MNTYVSILRGINVGGRRRIKMNELKQLYSSIRLLNIDTYIQSGNVVFNTEKNEDCKELANQIENAILDSFGFEVPVIIRTLSEIEQTVANNPFTKENNIENLHLTFLNDYPESEKLAAIENSDFSPDLFNAVDKDVFILCNGKYSDSKLSNTFFENKLRVPATTRNWKTVMQLYEMAKASNNKNLIIKP